VALDFLGQPLSSEGGGDRVETVVLDLESLQSYRNSFRRNSTPIPTRSRPEAAAMKKRTRITHLPDVPVRPTTGRSWRPSTSR